MDFMNAKLHKAVRTGDEDLLNRVVMDLNPLHFALVLTPQGNTVLHIAVTFEQEAMARKIINLCPSIVSQPNYKGDTPLHMAARAGRLRLSKLLTNLGSHSDLHQGSSGAPLSNGSEEIRTNVGTHTDLEQGSSGPPPPEGSEELRTNVITHSDLEQGSSEAPLSEGSEVWKVRNLEGNTAVHEAIKKRHGEVSLYLLGLDQNHELASVVNNAGESPLYLAAEAGLENVVSKIKEGQNYSVEGPDGQNPLHIAVIRLHLGIVRILLTGSGLINIEEADSFGKTALHYAAAGYKRAIFAELVSAAPRLLCASDNDGNCPLHIAATRGRCRGRIKDMLCHNPCAAELVDRKGRNVLHLAVLNTNEGTLRILLKWPELRVLINESDNDGNTPLHLAVKILHHSIVKYLLRKGADSSVTNKEGFTALDVCEFDKGFSFRQNVIRRLLKSRGAARGRLGWVEMMPVIMRHPLVHPNTDLESVAKTLSVVATLVATVTFAAAFTMPGGYKNNGPDEGMPVLIRKAALKAFVLSDTLSFCSSMTLAFLIIWALLGDPAFLTTAVNLGLNILWVAVPGMVVAFVMGLYVVVSEESLSLAIVVLCMGCSVPFLIFYAFRFSSSNTPSRFKFQGKIKSR